MTFIDYIKSHKKEVLLLLLCSMIHIVVLFVYGYETEPVLYAAVLYLFVMLLLEIACYLRERKKYRLLSSYDSNVDKSLQELLPVKEPIEREYQNIIWKVRKELMDNANAYLQREKASSDFYTMWVHQIKTPIAAQRILLQTTPENVAGIKSELFKIERYVDIILNFLRMENIHKDLLLKHYSLEAMVRQAVKKYSPLFIQSKLALKLEGLEAKVLTDEKWLVFVLEQLLSNSIKYTKRGGVHIFAEVSEDGEKKVTKLIMEDTGIGIHPEDLPRIFDRAFTGYNGRDDKRASGLGLYLCKNILEKLEHHISITSVLGEGTRVILTFNEDKSFCGNLTKL